MISRRTRSPSLAGIFEKHDQEAFEVFAFATNPGAGDYRLRIERAVAHFLDVSDLDDQALVAFAHRHHLDIAVDLTGLTQGGCGEAFARRMAPVQMQYLGYPGTSGMPNMDYVMVDRYIASENSSANFSGKLEFLPGTFQISERDRPSPVASISRRHLGVPDDAFLCGCFCNTYKINPRLFDIWMEILAAVPDSALLLYAPTSMAQDNLRDEAHRRKIDPARLYFSAWTPLPEYYARLRLIDLFLDTYPNNGGTTANDALWMGFHCSRAPGQPLPIAWAAALLSAMNLEERMTPSLEEYRSTAIRLANAWYHAPHRLRHAIDAHQIEPSGVFATMPAARALEARYLRALDRHRL